jgi:hypothetical protein
VSDFGEGRPWSRRQRSWRVPNVSQFKGWWASPIVLLLVGAGKSTWKIENNMIIWSKQPSSLALLIIVRAFPRLIKNNNSKP